MKRYRSYPIYAKTKVPATRIAGENNWGWRYPPHGGVCIRRKMWIEYLAEERLRPDPTYPLAQRLSWNYSPRKRHGTTKT